MDEIDNSFNSQADGIYSFLRNSFARLSNSSRSEQNAVQNSSNVNYQDPLPEERYAFNTLNPALASTLTEPDTFHLRRRRVIARLSHENNDFTDVIAQLPQSTPIAESDEASILTDSTGDVKVPLAAGGYSEDMFFYLSDKEKDAFACSICYAILKETYQCKNEHRFCYGCIYTWATGRGVGHDCCPMCRCDGLYAKNEEIDGRINTKRVRCLKQNCNWLGFLHEYVEHIHRYYEPTEMSIFSKATLEKLQRRKLAHLSRLAKGAVYNEFTLPNDEYAFSQAVRQNSSVEPIHHHEQEFSTTVLEPVQLSSNSSSGVDIGIQHSSCQPNVLEDRDNSNFDLADNTYCNDDFFLQNSYVNPYETVDPHRIGPFQQNLGRNNRPLSLTEARLLLRSINSQPLALPNGTSRFSSSSRNGQYTLNRNESVSNVTDFRSIVGSAGLISSDLRSTILPSDVPMLQTPRAYTEFDAELNVGQDNDNFSFSPGEFSNAISEGVLHDIFSYNDQSLPATRPPYRSQVNGRSIHATSSRPRFNPLNRPESVNEYVISGSEIDDTSSTRRRPELVYRRLVPVRPNQILEQLRETREQLTAMLNLMTAQLEGRRQNTLIDEGDSGPTVYDETTVDRGSRSRMRSMQILPSGNSTRESGNSTFSPSSVSTQETPLRFANTRNFALQHLARLHRIELLLNEINGSPSETSNSGRSNSQSRSLAPNSPVLETTNPAETARSRRVLNSLLHNRESNSDFNRYNLPNTPTETSSSNDNDNLTEAIRHAMSLWSSDDELS